MHIGEQPRASTQDVLQYTRNLHMKGVLQKGCAAPSMFFSHALTTDASISWDIVTQLLATA
jgi:hypothetical protein